MAVTQYRNRAYNDDRIAANWLMLNNPPPPEHAAAGTTATIDPAAISSTDSAHTRIDRIMVFLFSSRSMA
ncbi:MAG: hypothetical protein SGJ24_17515 [Chloroflexota bacterium]|nr:hypothetical protein [Chloroflexota bacterium]